MCSLYNIGLLRIIIVNSPGLLLILKNHDFMSVFTLIFYTFKPEYLRISGTIQAEKSWLIHAK